MEFARSRILVVKVLTSKVRRRRKDGDSYLAAVPVDSSLSAQDMMRSRNQQATLLGR